MGQEDADILRAAAKEGLTLFAFDVSIIPRVLVEMAVQGESHAGVVFASSKRTPQRDYASFAHALIRLWRSEGATEWTDRVSFFPFGRTDRFGVRVPL